MDCSICYDDRTNINTCICNTCNNSICLKCYDKIIVRCDKYKYNYNCPFCKSTNSNKIELLPPRNIINLLDNDYENKRDQEDINELYFALDFYKNLSIERLDRIQELKNEFEKSVVNSAINKCNLEVVNAENQKLKLDLELLNKKYSVVKTKYKNSITDNNLILNYQQNILNSLDNSIDLISKQLYITTMKVVENNDKIIETEVKTNKKPSKKIKNIRASVTDDDNEVKINVVKSKYQTFIKDNFKKFKSDNQELKNSEIFKLLAQEWKKSKN
jgi:hypothetical protein